MNYTWMRTDRLNRGMVAYRPVADATIIRIEPAGNLHLQLFYADGETETLRRDAPAMVQCCHRRRYENSTHHIPTISRRKD